MAETWKGPWKCEKCGRVIASIEEVRDDFHLTAPGGVFCDGAWLPYDRRASVEPAAEGLRAITQVLIDAGLHNRHVDVAALAQDIMRALYPAASRAREEKPHG